MIQSVERALVLLREVQERPGLSLTELSTRFALLPSTAVRLLSTLEAHGFVERDLATKRYHLGPAALGLGVRREPDLDLADRLSGQVSALAAAAGEQTSLAVLQGRQVVHLLVVDGASAAGEHVVLSEQAARRDSNLNATALGKIFLAFGPPVRTDAIIAELDMAQTASRTITDPAAFRRHLDRVCRNGYAFSIDENTDQVRGVAAPVRRADGSLACALAVHGPAIRLPRARLRDLARLVCQSATDCSRYLGYDAEASARHYVAR